MSKRNLILLVAAALIATMTAMAVRSRIQSPPPEAQQAALQRVLVAKQDIPAGNFVKVGVDIDWAAWPEGTVQAYHIVEGAEDINAYSGAVARRVIKAGEPISSGTLIKPGAGGFLSAVLEPGKRAMSIAVTETSAAAGFIFPGDRVDLIVTHRVRLSAAQGETGGAEETVMSETFIENVRVVAVDQQLDNPENKAMPAKTVTVEVTPEQAQKVSVALELGKVSLALRSLGNKEEQAAQPVVIDGATVQPDDIVNILQDAQEHSNITREGDVSPALDRSGSIKPRVSVFRGGEMEKKEFYNNGQ